MYLYRAIFFLCRDIEHMLFTDIELSGAGPVFVAMCHPSFEAYRQVLQGYLAHFKTPTP